MAKCGANSVVAMGSYGYGYGELKSDAKEGTICTYCTVAFFAVHSLNFVLNFETRERKGKG